MALLRVPRLVLAVNKMDLVDHDENTYWRIAKEFFGLTGALGYADEDVVAIPLSAKKGDNVVLRSENTPWYEGPTLLEHLESVPVAGADHSAPLRFPVQYVVRPRTESHPDYRGYAGLVAAGTVRAGDEVDGPARRAADPGRGHRHLRRRARRRPRRAERRPAPRRRPRDRPRRRHRRPGAPEPVTEFDATLAWLHEKPLKPGARLLLKHGTRTVQAIVSAVTHRLDTETLTLDEDPGELAINDMGQVSLTVSEPLPLDDYDVVAATGSFLLVDPQAGDTLGAGLVGRPLVAATFD